MSAFDPKRISAPHPRSKKPRTMPRPRMLRKLACVSKSCHMSAFDRNFPDQIMIRLPPYCSERRFISGMLTSSDQRHLACPHSGDFPAEVHKLACKIEPEIRGVLLA